MQTAISRFLRYLQVERNASVLTIKSYREDFEALRIVDATRPGEPFPDLGEVSAVVMFGGTANADEVDEHPFLLQDRALTREAVDREVPYLGICLGAQILARALDRPVVKAPKREVGFEPVHPTPAASQMPKVAPNPSSSAARIVSRLINPGAGITRILRPTGRCGYWGLHDPRLKNRVSTG